MRKSMEETLEEIEKKQQGLAERKKLIQNKIAIITRKDRTRQLIQVGAIIENALPITNTFNAEALANYYASHPDAHAEVSQYIIDKTPMIQVQREQEHVATRRNIRGSVSSDTSN